MRRDGHWTIAAGAVVALALLAAGSAWAEPAVDPAAAPPAKAPPAPTTRPEELSLREIRVAICGFDVLKGVEMDPAALTDQVNASLDSLPKIKIVNRDQVKKVAEEHMIAQSGLVDKDTAVRLGKFLSAQYVVVGRASKIGQTFYLVVKVVDVETTVQTTISVKSAAQAGPEGLLDKLTFALSEKLKELQKPVQAPADIAWARLKELAKPLAGKVVVVDVSESHISRPLVDPAAQMAISTRLRGLGIEAVAPKDPVDGWKKSLLETGKYGEKKVDFLLEGEGVSALALGGAAGATVGTAEGLVSCRARVELRLIPVPGRSVSVSDKGVGARVDLVEALAAKAALEDAGANALDSLLPQWVKLLEKK